MNQKILALAVERQLLKGGIFQYSPPPNSNRWQFDRQGLHSLKPSLWDESERRCIAEERYFLRQFFPRLNSKTRKRLARKSVMRFRKTREMLQ